MKLLSVDQIKGLISTNIERQDSCTLAISGGRSVRAVCRHLSHTKLDWGKVTVTTVDERCVNPCHVDSNQRQIQNILIKNNAKNCRLIPLVDWEITNYPDIAIFGMGTDGHFASLFPGVADDNELFDLNHEPCVLKIEETDAIKHARLTMNLSFFIKIPTLILVVSGGARKQVLDQAVTDGKYPIHKLLQYRDDLGVIVQS